MAMTDVMKLSVPEKERAVLRTTEVVDLIPDEVHSAQDVDDLLATIRRRGLGVFEGSLLYLTRQ